MATDSHETTATDMADAAVGACVDSHGSALGMPQLCADWAGNQVFWLLVTLVAIYFILSKIALPRIAAVLAERNGTITNDIAAAEELKLKAVEAEKAYNQALADARSEAQKIAADTRAEIQAELDDAIAKADAEIAARAAESAEKIGEIRESAVESIGEVAKEAAAEIVSALGREADAGAVASAVADQMKGGA